MLEWLSKDGKLLMLARGSRAFAYGFLSLILAVYLMLIGLGGLEIGIIISATLLSSAVSTFIVSLFADKLGRQRILILLSTLMGVSGIMFALTTNFVSLLIAALIGTINVTGTEIGAFLSIEQATLVQTCPEEKRTLVLSVYNISGTLATAFGVLFGSLPEFLFPLSGGSLIDSFKPLFILYSIIAFFSIGVYSMLSSGAEKSRTKLASEGRHILKPESRRRISKLSAFFAIDSFAGGFVIQTFVAFWFFTKFGMSLATLSLIFFVANILTASSFLIAVRVASKIGLVKTIVFSHMASNLFLIMIPLAPSLLLALIFYLVRMSLSQMDVPTRQSYVVAIVSSQERIPAAGFTNLSRNISQAISPSIAGYILQFVSLSAPFFFGGILKITYDLLLYSSFRKIKPPEEVSNSNFTKVTNDAKTSGTRTVLGGLTREKD